MEGTIVVFRLPEGSPRSAHRRLHRRIYGDQTSSWGGKYEYHRRGLLDEIPHVLLYWGVIVIRREDERRLLGTLREAGAIAVRRSIKLTLGDRRALEKRAR